MLPSRRHTRSRVLQTSLSPDAILAKKLEKEKEGENGFAEQSVVCHISSSDEISLRDVARERVDIISEKMQHLPDEFLEKLKNELRVIFEGSGGSMHREKFLFLKKLVQSRSDLTDKALTRAHRVQLEILVAIKSGIQAFLHPRVSLSQASLSEVFLYKRCRNLACGSPLPADDCNCEPCAMKSWFCNSCMCVICNKFDFETNTCRWIGCDLCDHWTHTDCAIRNELIKNGSAPLDMIFRCIACNRTSELLGWVKEVLQKCAPSCDREALIKELDFVSRIFHGSENPRGRILFWKCEDLIDKLKGGMAEPMACKVILMIFQECVPTSRCVRRDCDHDDNNDYISTWPPRKRKIVHSPRNSVQMGSIKELRVSTPAVQNENLTTVEQKYGDNFSVPVIDRSSEIFFTDLSLGIGMNNTRTPYPLPHSIGETSTKETDDPITAEETSFRDIRTLFSASTVQSELRVTVKAKFGGDFFTFQLFSSSGIHELDHQLSQGLNLEVGTYVIKYLDDDDDLILIVCDDDLHQYISSSISKGRFTLEIMIEPIKTL